MNPPEPEAETFIPGPLDRLAAEADFSSVVPKGRMGGRVGVACCVEDPEGSYVYCEVRDDPALDPVTGRLDAVFTGTGVFSNSSIAAASQAQRTRGVSTLGDLSRTRTRRRTRKRKSLTQLFVTEIEPVHHLEIVLLVHFTRIEIIIIVIPHPTSPLALLLLLVLVLVPSPIPSGTRGGQVTIRSRLVD